MILKKIMDYPILMIGILFMIIFIYYLQGNNFFKDYYNNLQANSCRSALVKLDKRKPSSWNTKCQKTNMSITIQSEIYKETYKNINNYKGALYRELANSLVFISKNAANNSLEKVPWVTIHFLSDKIDIAARTKGKLLAAFATLKSKQMIAEHLQTSVEVKENIK